MTADDQTDVMASNDADDAPDLDLQDLTSATVPTCKIVSADTAAGYVIVNVSDFDAATMQLFVRRKR